MPRRKYPVIKGPILRRRRGKGGGSGEEEGENRLLCTCRIAPDHIQMPRSWPPILLISALYSVCWREGNRREERGEEKRGRKERERARERRRERRENPPVCTFKTPPCVRSGRLRVYRQQARMCSTCGPVGGTHGDVLTVHTEAF